MRDIFIWMWFQECPTNVTHNPITKVQSFTQENYKFSASFISLPITILPHDTTFGPLFSEYIEYANGMTIEK